MTVIKKACQWSRISCRDIKGLASEDLSKVKGLGAFFSNSHLTVNPKRVKGKGKSLRRKLTEFSGTYLTTYTLLPPIHPQLAHLERSNPPRHNCCQWLRTRPPHAHWTNGRARGVSPERGRERVPGGRRGLTEDPGLGAAAGSSTLSLSLLLSTLFPSSPRPLVQQRRLPFLPQLSSLLPSLTDPRVRPPWLYSLRPPGYSELR